MINFLLTLLLVAFNLSDCSCGGSKTMDQKTEDKTSENKDGSEATVFKATGKYQFIDFGAETCIPCKQMVPVMDSLKVKYAGVMDVTFIDVRKSENKGLCQSAGIRLIPTQFIVDPKGKILESHQGFWSYEEITKKLVEFNVEPAQRK